MADPSELSKLRRWRGVAKGSITRIESWLSDLEGDPGRQNIRDSARQMLAKLKEHDGDFGKNHLTLIDLIDDKTLITEHATLDEHDDLVTALTVRIMTLADSTTTSTKEVSAREFPVHRCDRLESSLTETGTALMSLIHEDVCKLQQYQEQALDFKRDWWNQ